MRDSHIEHAEIADTRQQGGQQASKDGTTTDPRERAYSSITEDTVESVELEFEAILRSNP